MIWKKLREFRRHRKGASALILAISAPVLVGVAGLAVDTAVLGVSRAQLQTAADAAALAGAAQLEHDTVTVAYTTAARDSAVSFAGKNKVLGSAVSLSSSQDLAVGYISPTDTTETLSTDSSMLAQFNAVRVTASRTSTHGGSIPRIFSGAGTDMKVSSTAVVLAATGFQRVDSATYVQCLPIALDKTTAVNMFSSKTSDLYKYNTASNTVVSGSDGIAESVVYPVSNASAGNWGTVNIGVSNNGTSTLNAQISSGISPSQMATFTNAILKPDASTGLIVLGGNPGISAGIKSALNSIVGQTRWMPIYDPSQSGGNGNNAYYTIVSFAPVRVMAVNFTGSNKYVVVQPATMSRTDKTIYWDVRPANSYPRSYKVALIR